MSKKHHNMGKIYLLKITEDIKIIWMEYFVFLLWKNLYCECQISPKLKSPAFFKLTQSIIYFQRRKRSIRDAQRSFPS